MTKETKDPNPEGAPPALVYPDVLATLAPLGEAGEAVESGEFEGPGSIAPAYGCPPVGEPLYDLELEGYSSKIEAIRGVREVVGCDLPGAVRLLGMVPVRLLENAEAVEARETAARLEKWGWTVRVNPAPFPAPSTFHLEVTGFKGKIAAIHGLRSWFGYTLPEAVGLLGKLPARVRSNASSAEVQRLAQRLEQYGCTVQIKRGDA